MSEFIQLYRLYMKASARMAMSHWMRELVMLICSGVMVALFLYVFNDFLSEQIASINPKFYDQLRKTVEVFVWMVTTTMAVIIGKRYHDFFRWLRRHRNQKVATHIAIAIAFTRVAVVFTLGYFLCWALIGVKPEMTYLFAGTGLLAGFIAAYLFQAQVKRKPSDRREIDPKGSRLAQLVSWRWQIIWWRNPFSRVFLTVALLMLGFQLVIGVRGDFLPVQALIALGFGFVMSLPLATQLATDLVSIQFERMLGIAHDDYVHIYDRLSLRIAVLNTFLCLGVTTISALLSTPPPTMNLISLVFLPAVAPLLFTALMFQIDARRPFVVSVTVLLSTLFIGTAVFAHPAAILLIPVVRYYGIHYAKDYLYRI